MMEPIRSRISISSSTPTKTSLSYSTTRTRFLEYSPNSPYPMLPKTDNPKKGSSLASPERWSLMSGRTSHSGLTQASALRLDQIFWICTLGKLAKLLAWSFKRRWKILLIARLESSKRSSTTLNYRIALCSWNRFSFCKCGSWTIRWIEYSWQMKCVMMLLWFRY